MDNLPQTHIMGRLGTPALKVENPAHASFACAGFSVRLCGMSTHNEDGHRHQVSSFIDDCVICRREIVVYSACEHTDCRRFVTLDYGNTTLARATKHKMKHTAIQDQLLSWE